MIFKINILIISVILFIGCSSTEIIGKGNINAGRDIYIPENTKKIDINLTAGNDVYFGVVKTNDSQTENSSISKDGITISISD